MTNNMLSDLPKYRLAQLDQAKYKNFITNLQDVKSWPLSLREQYQNIISLFSLEYVRQSISLGHETVKVIFARKSDKLKFETVLIKSTDKRNTICVSCMIGCPVNCAFCATGKMGFKGNLTSEEIVDQVIYFAAYLKATNEKITNVVYMGMGEPMLNLTNVLQSVEILTTKLELSPRRLTISTSGYLPQIKELLHAGFKGKLAISLHAATQEKREKLMPIAKVYKLPQLMQTLDEYVKATNKRITYEYILIDEVNDTEDDAIALAKLLKNRLAHVNLIPYNSISGANFTRSKKENIIKFRDILLQYNINVTVRATMGADKDSACGQLALKS